MDRATDFGSVGWGFDSLQAHVTPPSCMLVGSLRAGATLEPGETMCVIAFESAHTTDESPGMSETVPTEITLLLHRLRAGEGDPAPLRERLYELLYGQLRSLADLLMRGERRDHTLQPTEVVNEAFLKLGGATALDLRDRTHFLAIAARAMRQVLVDHARTRQAEKRGGQAPRVTFDDDLARGLDAATEVLEVERALERLAVLSTRMAHVVECRIFGGMTHEEIAESLSISPRTVAEDWSVGRRFLRRELLGGTA